MCDVDRELGMQALVSISAFVFKLSEYMQRRGGGRGVGRSAPELLESYKIWCVEKSIWFYFHVMANSIYSHAENVSKV